MPFLVAALVIVPLVEIYLLLQVGQVIGALPTVALLVAMSVLGAWLLKWEGTRTWRAFQAALQSGRVPTVEVADGALVIFGGALLLTPGFATDLFGLLCLLPGSRAVLRRLLTAFAVKRFGVTGMAGAIAADRMGPRRAGPRQTGGTVVDGTVVDGTGAGHESSPGDPQGPPGRSPDRG